MPEALVSDFEIILKESSFGRVRKNRALVSLSCYCCEEDVKFYTAITQHEVLHLVLKKLGIPLKTQPEYVLDQVQIWTDLWLDM